MSPELQAALANAYEADQLGHNHVGAVTELRAALAADAGLREKATAERDRLAEVVAARESGGQHGDHVSAVLLLVLTKALAGE